MTTSNVTLGVIGAVLVALIGAVGALALHGTITGDDALTVLGPLVALIAGAAAHAFGVQAGSTAAVTGVASVTPAPVAVKQAP